MARLLVQLKLRLLRNALNSSTAARVSFLVSSYGALIVAIGVFWILSLLRGSSVSVDLTSIIFTGFAVGWLVLPIFAFGLDGTLDPAALALYPLRTRPLATGLLAASAAGAWPVANVLGLLGVTVGLARGGLGLLVAVAAVVLQVLFCLVLARFVTTSMAGLLRSRRGKDLAAFLIIPIIAVYEFFGQVLPRVIADGGITVASLNGVDQWLRWLPPGLAAHAIQDASEGRPGQAVLRLGLLAGIVVVLGWLWVRSLSRALVTTDSSTQSSGVRGAVLPLARYGLRGAVAARFWIYQRREPASLVFWGMTAVITIAVSSGAILGHQRHPGVLLFSAAIGAAQVGYLHANTVGLTGPPFVLEATALTGRRTLRAYFAGQDMVLAAIGVPLLAAISFGLAAVAGRPMWGFLLTAVNLAGLGAALAVANILGATSAYPMAKRAGSPMRQAAQGYGAYTFGAVLGTFAAVGVAATPLFVIGAFTGAHPAVIPMVGLVIGAAAYGLALAWGGVWLAAREAEGKLPELCQVAVASTL